MPPPDLYRRGIEKVVGRPSHIPCTFYPHTRPYRAPIQNRTGTSSVPRTYANHCHHEGVFCQGATGFYLISPRLRSRSCVPTRAVSLPPNNGTQRDITWIYVKDDKPDFPCCAEWENQTPALRLRNAYAITTSIRRAR